MDAHERRWRSDVEADIALLRAADVRPYAIWMRLSELLNNIKPNTYPGFSACGRGTSFYGSENGRPIVSLEFRFGERAEPTVETLNRLRDQFKAIEEIRFTRYGENKRQGALTLKLRTRST